MVTTDSDVFTDLLEKLTRHEDLTDRRGRGGDGAR